MYRWIVLAAATFTQAAAAFFTQGLGALGVQLQSDLGLNAAELGLLTSAAQLVPLVGLLIAGRLLDRFDERWVVGVGSGLVGIALLFGALAPGYAALLAALMVVGAGYSTVQPGGSTSVAAWFSDSRRGTAMGIRQAGLPLGALLASAILPPVAVAHGWRAAVGAGGIVALTGAIVFVAVYRRPPGHATVALTTQKSPPLVRPMLVGLSLVSVHTGVSLLGVLHLHETAGLSPAHAALVVVAVQGAGALGRILLAALSDRPRVTRQSVVTAAMVAVIIGLLLLATPLGRDPLAAGLLLGWLGFFGIGWYGPWVALVAEAAPAGRRGTALGLLMSVNQVAVVVAPPALGFLRDVTGGFTTPWVTLAGLTAVTLLRKPVKPIGERDGSAHTWGIDDHRLPCGDDDLTHR